MSNNHDPQIDQVSRDQRHPDRQFTYQIRVEGHLGRQWARWFEEMSITLDENGETLVTGTVVDQAALHSLLRKIRDIGAPLVSVLRLDTARSDAK